jgi:hypothetical protein
MLKVKDIFYPLTKEMLPLVRQRFLLSGLQRRGFRKRGSDEVGVRR